MRAESQLKRGLLWLMGCFYVFAGTGHFAKSEFYLPMMPRSLPYPLALIYLSGFAEIGLGLAVLIPRLLPGQRTHRAARRAALRRNRGSRRMELGAVAVPGGADRLGVLVHEVGTLLR